MAPDSNKDEGLETHWLDSQREGIRHSVCATEVQGPDELWSEWPR